MKEKKIVIVGGGISGLATAYYLKKKINELGRSDTVLLLEKNPRVGGSVQSVKDQGFIFDGGPRGFLAEGRRTLELCKDLGVWDQIQVSSDDARIRYVWKNQKLNRLPSKPTDLFTSKLIGWKEIKTVLAEYFKRNSPSIEDESVAEFIIRRFSDDILDYFAELLITGIHAGNPKRLSAQSIFPKLKELEKQYGSILKGFIKSKKVKPNESFDPEIMAINKRKLVSFNEGMETLVDALKENLSQSIKTGVNIKNILFQKQTPSIIKYEHNGSDFEVEADFLIFSSPAYITAELVKPLSQELSQLLSEIDYAHIHVINFGYHKRVHDYKGFGFLSPRKEKLNMLGCIWNEMVFPTLAPSDGINLTIMYGGACHPEMKAWNEDQLLSEAVRELELTMNIKDKPDIVRFFHYDKGIPQYNIGHLRRIQKIKDIVKKFPYIILLGNYISGVGINDCVKNAYQLVKDLDL